MKGYTPLRIGLVLLVVTVVAMTFFYFLPATTPWESTGRLVILAGTAPGATYDEVLGLGIDDMFLVRDDGSVKHVTIRSRRINLDQQTNDLTILLDTKAPTGTYTNFGFTLNSPEQRNTWQEDTPPTPVSLVHDAVSLGAAYTIREDETTILVLGFETRTALHTRATTTLYLPVLHIETREGATLLQGESGTPQVEGGTIIASATFGMDWDGRMRRNFRAKDPTEPRDVSPQTSLPSASLPVENQPAENPIAVGSTTNENVLLSTSTETTQQ